MQFFSNCFDYKQKDGYFVLSIAFATNITSFKIIDG